MGEAVARREERNQRNISDTEASTLGKRVPHRHLMLHLTGREAGREKRLQAEGRGREGREGAQQQSGKTCWLRPG